MSINESHFGESRQIPLVPFGDSIPVTSENRQIYIAKYANYILNQRTKEQTVAFVSGLKSVLPDASLDLFFPDEIQKLISGGVNDISIQDLMANTRFNGYNVDERALKTMHLDDTPDDKIEDTSYILEFFAYLGSLPNEQKERFLQFSTGTNRPPLLGFKYMYPNFALVKIPVESPDVLRLCSASTCGNMFKLPFFGTSSKGLEKMRQSVHKSINSGAGFDFA
jgi:ubiquitin-protein ligase E3 C